MKQSLLYSRCRRIALAIGDEFVRSQLLSVRDDIFFLTVSEIDELASGVTTVPQDVRDLVAVRARAHAGFAAATPPDSFTLAEGEYLTSDFLRKTTRAPHDRSGAMFDLVEGP
jgi:hypothetical protein